MYDNRSVNEVTNAWKHHKTRNSLPSVTMLSQALLSLEIQESERPNIRDYCCSVALNSSWLLFSHVGPFWNSMNWACQPSLSFTISQILLKLMPIESVMPSYLHLILWHPLLLLPSTFPSIRVFSNEVAHHIRWPKFWSLSFSISPSHEYSGLISFRMDWFDLLAVQGTLKSFL